MSREDLREADLELVEFYTASIGVKAQSYEFGTGDPGDTSRLHDRLIKQYERGSFSRHDAVAATLAQLDPAHRRIADIVYMPFGTWFAEQWAFVCGPCGKSYQSSVAKCRHCSANRDQIRGAGDETDLLAAKLVGRWSHGSYVRMALSRSRTLSAYAKDYPSSGTPTVAKLLQYLSHEAGRGTERDQLFKGLCEDCSVPHTHAVEAYNELRVIRIDSEIKTRRERRRTKEAASAALLEAELGAKSQRARARYERRLRG